MGKMTVAQTKRAGQKMRQRYGRAHQHRSVGEQIDSERRQAAKEANRKKAGKK
jgi:hypothetical protein